MFISYNHGCEFNNLEDYETYYMHSYAFQIKKPKKSFFCILFFEYILIDIDHWNGNYLNLYYQSKIQQI